MTIHLLILLCLLAGLFLLVFGVRRLYRRRLITGGICGSLALAFFIAAAAVALLDAQLRTYQRLSFEQNAAQLEFKRLADRQYRVLLTFPGRGAGDTYLLRGDEWQIDGRLIKWQPLANVLGFDTDYRLERLGGRYANIDDERLMPRTVYALNPPQAIDLWDLARRHPRWFPWLDALYGSAAYVPMADGAIYEVTVSQSGLVARPLNDAARAAVGGWH
jgi:hypothetical protein